MSIPVDHHYLPKFYLRRWANPQTGKVWEFSRPHENLAVCQRSVRATGKLAGLYSLPGEPDPQLREQIELRFMQPVDSVAAAALAEILETKQRPLDQGLRDGWARFIMSLLHRSPARQQYFERKLREQQEEVFDDLVDRLSDDYLKIRKPSDPATIEEYLHSTRDQSARRSSVALMRSLIDSEMIGSAIVGMKWGLIGIAGGPYGLLTSDSPVMTSNGLNHDRSFFLMPVAPDAIFIASANSEVAESFVDQRTSVLERAINDAICRQAETLVIGSSQVHRRFVDNRFKRYPLDKETSHLAGRLTWRAPIA